MKKYLILLLIPFMFVSCANDITSDAYIPKAPIVTESAKPDLDKTNVDIDKSIEGNVRIDENIKDQIQALVDQNKSISQVLLQAETIKIKADSKVLVTEIEAVNLIEELKKVESRNLLLETDTNKISGIIKKQKIDLNTAKVNLKNATDKANDKESEAREAQDKLAQVSASVKLKNVEVSQLQKEKEKLIKQAADAKVYKKIILWSVGIFLLWLVVKNVLMVYLPTTRFRI